MPCLVFSDPHFHGFKQFSKQVGDGYPSRLLLIENAFKEAVDFGVEQGAEDLLITGDLYHVRAYVKSTVAKVAHRCLIYAMSKGLKPILLVGNHDLENFKYGISSLDVFEGLTHNGLEVTVIKEPMVLDRPYGKVAGVPYCHELSEFNEEYNRLLQHNPRITLIHQGIDDFRPTTNMPETKITAALLAQNNENWVFAGHYHSAMASQTHPRIVSPGSLVPHNFNDSDRASYAYVLLDDDTLLHHQITSHPHFTTAKVNSIAAARKIDVSNKFVRWFVTKTALANKIREYCEEAGCPGFVINIEKEFTSAHSKTVKIASPETMLFDYIDIVPKLQPHKEDLLRLYGELRGGSS